MSRRVAGCIAAGIGIALFLVAALDSRETAFKFGRHAVGAGGLAFLFAGVALLLPPWRSKYRPALQTLVGTLILAAFAALAGLVSLGNPILMLLSFLPCVALTGLGVWATVRDFRAAWRETSKTSDP